MAHVPRQPHAPCRGDRLVVVPTATFRSLYVFVVLAHERRRIVHCNVTDAPCARWTGIIATTDAPPEVLRIHNVSISQMQGSMSQRSVAESAALERANYVKVLHSYALHDRSRTA